MWIKHLCRGKSCLKWFACLEIIIWRIWRAEAGIWTQALGFLPWHALRQDHRPIGYQATSPRPQFMLFWQLRGYAARVSYVFREILSCPFDGVGKPFTARWIRFAYFLQVTFLDSFSRSSGRVNSGLASLHRILLTNELFLCIFSPIPSPCFLCCSVQRCSRDFLLFCPACVDLSWPYFHFPFQSGACALL